MLRTVSIKLTVSTEQSAALKKLQESFNLACNSIAVIAAKNRCWNRTALHHLSYYQIRSDKDKPLVLGSQMVCNAIRAVCDAYKILKVKSNESAPLVTFKQKSSVHFDKRTYSLKDGAISLYTLSGRILAPMILGKFQQAYLRQGRPKEAELINRGDQWFFNIVLDMPDVLALSPVGKILGVDLGENNLAATSSGKFFGGGKLRHDRDCALSLRASLQSNGSKSAKQLLKKISGKEARHVKHVNHVISKAIVDEAKTTGCDTIAMEALTNIRLRIRAGKRVRSRLHRWSWAQLQEFVQYKGQAAGLTLYSFLLHIQAKRALIVDK